MVSGIVTSLVVTMGMALAADSAASPESNQLAVSFVSYKDAYRRAQEERLPLVVFVGAEWCPACRKMDEAVFPNLPQSPILKNGVFARVDYDQDTKLAQAITGGGALPQVIIFPPQGSGQKLRRVVGAQPVEKLFQFLREGLSLKRDPAGSTAMTGTPIRGD